MDPGHVFHLVLYSDWRSAALSVRTMCFIIVCVCVKFRWYIEKEIFMVYYETNGKKENKWEFSHGLVNSLY